VQNLNRGPPPETPLVSTPHPDSFNFEKIMILQSPLDPKIPIDSLQGMPTMVGCPFENYLWIMD